MYSTRKAEMVTHFINFIHDFEEDKHGWIWNDVLQDKRHTLYPNLVAHIAIEVPQLSYISDSARVTPRLMSAVIEQGEAFTYDEIMRAGMYCNSLHELHKIKPLPLSYYFSPDLSVLDISRRKDYLRLLELEAELESAKRLLQNVPANLDPITRLLVENADIEFSERTVFRMRSGVVISFAEYYVALLRIRDILQISTRLTAKCHPVRDLA